jgi:hypothetical protein
LTSGLFLRSFAGTKYRWAYYLRRAVASMFNTLS